jgi:hypothetical protein
MSQDRTDIGDIVPLIFSGKVPLVLGGGRARTIHPAQ